MLKARALFYALVVSLLIALVSGSLISLAHLQRQQQADQFGRERQIRNLNSGIALAMGGLHNQKTTQKIDLYEKESDWLELRRSNWGFFDVAWARIPSSSSTYKACILGNRENPSLRPALYLCDQVAPLTLAGRTLIKGEAKLPSNGVKAGYINGENFIGGRLIEGKQSKSGPYLPEFDEKRVEQLNHYYQLSIKENKELPAKIEHSFTDSTLIMTAPAFYLNQLDWRGNMIIIARDSIIVSANCILEDLLLFAPKIVFEDRFEGRVQAFASRQLDVGSACQFSYPTVLAILKTDKDLNRPKLQIKQDSQVEGLIFAYQKTNSRQPIQVKVEENTLIKGQLFINGQLELKGTVHGNVSCKTFLLETSSSLYSNYLYNTNINRDLLSKHYVSSFLFSDHQESEVVRWVE